MLAAIISLLQDDVRPQPRPRTQIIDLGSGGGANVPMYDIVDYVDVLNTFRDQPGEIPLHRAARRARHLKDGLPAAFHARAAREGRAAAQGFLLGAGLEAMRAHEAAEAVEATLQAAIVTAVELRVELAAQKAEIARRDADEAQRKASRRSGGGLFAGFLLGVGVVFAISRKAT